VLYKLPRHLPTFPEICEAMGRPALSTLAGALGVCEETVARWQRRGRAPKAATLALWLMSPAGLAELDGDLHTYARLQTDLARALQDEMRQVRRELGRLASMRYGAANGPSLRADLVLWRVK
jgi:hypothetical protein